MAVERRHGKLHRQFATLGLLLVLGFGCLQFFGLASTKTSLKSAANASPKSQLRDGCLHCLHPYVVTNQSLPISTFHEGRKASLSVGELPGYTGWARPEFTLAGNFRISSISSTSPKAGDLISIQVSCVSSSNECRSSRSSFFLRAYGPSVVPGYATTPTTQSQSQDYTFHFRIIDAGTYTVEAVLAFSNILPIQNYPLSQGTTEPSFEGYLLPEFPLIVTVHDNDSAGKQATGQTDSICTMENLTVTGMPEEGRDDPFVHTLHQARWRVISKSITSTAQQGDHQSKPGDAITSDGYKHNRNSLGITMEYDFNTCRLLPSSRFAQDHGTNHPFHSCGKVMPGGSHRLQIILIGDSVMRIQKDTFEQFVGHLSKIDVTFLELYGGFRRVVANNKPNIRGRLRRIQETRPDDPKVIVFNTGLHDIHRLCGQEWEQDRREYLDVRVLDSGTFRCVEEYKQLLQDFVDLVNQFPVDLKIFQLTSAGWPKYGNFGFEWPTGGGQALPLDSEFVAHFNKIALEVLLPHKDIHIVDGYWMTYARPDNREIGDGSNTIGHKLSHPGLEVQSAMVRIWALVMLVEVCKFKGV